MYKYFTEDELKCKCGCETVNMDKEFMQKLDELRETCGFPFVITSAYRCPEYNEKVSTTGKNGPHTTGKAVDIKANSREKYKIVTNTVFSRIGVGKNFIHLDNLTENYGFSEDIIWTY